MITSKNSKIFWGNVRRLRENKEYNATQLATIIGLNHKIYSNRERMGGRVSMELACKIAKALETTVDLLIIGKEPEESPFNPKIVSFFNKVRIRREMLNISQKDMAKMLGISPTNWSTKENGKVAKLPKSLVDKITDILKCTTNDLMDDNEVLKVANIHNFWDKSRDFRIKYNIPQSAMAELMGISLNEYVSKEIIPPRKEYHIPHITTDDEEYNALSKRTKEAVDLYPDHLRPKVSKAKAHNDVREMAIDFLEMSVGNYANNKITHTDYTRWIPGLIERGIVEESSKGIYRLTDKFAEPM